MRNYKGFFFFATHYDWYTCVKGKGYVPTEKAPPEAIEAMKRVNKRNKKSYLKIARKKLSLLLRWVVL